MATVEDKVLGVLSSSVSAVHDIYTVPAGRIAVVRYIHVENDGGSAFNISSGIDRAGTLYTLVYRNPTPDGGLLQWQGWQVMEAGSKLFVYNAAAHLVQAYASGYEVTP